MSEHFGEHLPDIEIERIDIENAVDRVHDGTGFAVGHQAQCAGVRWSSQIVTRIEAFTKSGMHAFIPYIRVWCGDEPVAEFCQHQIVGVYFKRKSA